jgi:RHS repeat-associated protein
VYLFTFNYSATTGLPTALTYPISTAGVAFKLNYAYQYGLLESVTDATDTTATCGSTCTLWTANSMNAFGEIAQETLGNGVVTNRTYDPVTSWLVKATAGVGGGAALLNQSYTQDENGNVTQRQNNNLGLTETFSYDADNRLTCTVLGSSCSSPTYTYDSGVAGPSNITSHTGVGTYNYPASGQAQPHAVTSITGFAYGVNNPRFSYDANGNMTARASTSQNILWTSYNYPYSISGADTGGTGTVALNYGPDRQRIQQNYSVNSGSVESTFYVGGLMDIVKLNGTVDYRHYIYVGKEPITIYSRTLAGGITMSYILKDQLGGVSTIASNMGAVDVNESFAAFGNRRNSGTWSGAPTTADLTYSSYTRQSYAFQTALGQNTGLNHMNGRIQDVVIGGFLSPDPHIQDPTNSQNYNRYSYVNNNPLTFVDPTGFEEDCGASNGFCPDSQSTDPAALDPAIYGANGSIGGADIDELKVFGHRDTFEWEWLSLQDIHLFVTPYIVSFADVATVVAFNNYKKQIQQQNPCSGDNPQNFAETDAWADSLNGVGLTGEIIGADSEAIGALSQIGGIASDGTFIAGKFNAGVLQTNATATRFWADAGSRIARNFSFLSVAYDAFQTFDNLDSVDGFFHGVDALVDLGGSRLGLAGAGVSMLWTATGGMKGASLNPSINQNVEMGGDLYAKCVKH